MGIDVYMHWHNQTPEDDEAQITGFSIAAGDVGYLREAYHGGPYATRWLLRECFMEPPPSYDENCLDAYKGEPITAATLRDRLPATVFLALARHAIVYDEPFLPGDNKIPPVINLPEDATIDDGAGGERIIATNPMVHDALIKVFKDIAKMRSGELERDVATRMTDEQIRAMSDLIKTGNLPDYALAFVNFVRLAELKEKETGEPVRVYVSY